MPTSVWPRSHGPVEVAVPLVDVDPASVVTLDLTTTSDVYDFAFSDDGSLTAGVEDELARAAVQNGARLVVTQYGQARLSRTRKLSQESPDVVATGISLWAASATPMIAPWDGEVTADDVVTLRGARLRADADRRACSGVGQCECRSAAGRCTGRSMGGGRCAAGRRIRGAAAHPGRDCAGLAGADP